MPRAGQYEDLEGQQFGKLTAIRVHEILTKKTKNRIRRYVVWECCCECGNKCYVRSVDLKSGHTTSCGCYMKQARSNGLHTTHGLSKTRIYDIYNGMKNRCYNANEPSYSHYGGRGIRICEEWLNNFLSFYEWSLANGYDESLPSNRCTIERIDVDGDYCPENCAWISMKEQGWNKTNTRYVAYEGRRMSVAEASELSGINAKTIYARLSRGHDPFVAQRKSHIKSSDVA